MKILYINGDSSELQRVRKSLRKVLTDALLESAPNLPGGLALLERGRFDALLLDSELAAGSALQALRGIRRAAPNMPIVAITASEDRELASEAIRLGAQDCLVKGRFEGELLVRVIRYAIERQEGLEALAEAEERYRRLYEGVGAGVFELDEGGRVTAANPALVRMLEYRSERDLLGVDFASDVFLSRSDFKRWFAAARSKGSVPATKLRLQSRYKRTLVVRGQLHALLGRAGQVTGYQGLLTDVTEVDRLSRQLTYESRHDALTDLFNRRVFEERLKEALARGRCGVKFALCQADIDQFKIINDVCGHAAGDELLKRLGEMLRRRMRRQDLLARIGGDELGVLLEVGDAEEAFAAAKRLLAAIEDFRFDYDDRVFDISASIGLVLIDGFDYDVRELMIAADTACAMAKDRGGGRVYVGEPGAETLNRRIGEMQWVVKLKAAVNENRLLLFQQPIACLHEGRRKARHFEVLVRKAGKDGTIHAPQAFLPAMERFNLGPIIDRWVVGAVLAWLGEHREALGPLRCAVNLSGQSLGEPWFLGFLQRTLDMSNVPPEALCFEITESAVIRNLSAAKQLIAALKARGCRFSLDDFGSGLSSFAYLRDLDVDYVKIDGVFVKSIATDLIDRATVKSIAEMAHAMGKETIAECVENESAIGLLKELGIDHVQGYAIGMPAPIEELLGAPGEAGGALARPAVGRPAGALRARAAKAAGLGEP